jgi:hypothetical protein
VVRKTSVVISSDTPCNFYKEYLPRRRWEDNIKMDFREMECGGMDCIELVMDRDRWRALVNVVIKLRVHSNAGNFLTS